MELLCSKCGRGTEFAVPASGVVVRTLGADVGCCDLGICVLTAMLTGTTVTLCLR
jgi:hypothetical protein